jgi:cobalt-zinc-cadmium efflux system protein
VIIFCLNSWNIDTRIIVNDINIEYQTEGHFIRQVICSRKMSETHSHNHFSTQKSKRRLKIALGIVLVIMVVEVVGGIISNSLALIGDAGHMLVDALAMGLSLFAITIASRPATLKRTYGYHRAEIIAALANGTFLLLIAAYIFYEAYQRLTDPPVINTTYMLLVAAIGLGANLAGIFLLKGASHGSLNIRAAFWHIIGDTVSSAGVIVAGLIILFTGWNQADPIIAIFVGCIILWGAIRLVRESADILLEAVPKHIQVDEVVDMIKGINGVEEVHDIHIWTITSGIYALSAHLVIGDQMVSRTEEILREVNHNLDENYGIGHTTLQLECNSCTTGLICGVSRPEHD